MRRIRTRAGRICAITAALMVTATGIAHAQRTAPVFTRADTLRGSNGPARAWWDVTFYDLHVTVNPADSTIHGYNGITYRALKPGREMQIDMQLPMEIDSMRQNGRAISYRRDGNAFFATLSATQKAGTSATIRVYYHGKPVAAKNPPWDGGYIWRKDSVGNTWVSTANEGLGASVWWPNKDFLADEPDSQRIAVTVPDPMMDVSNGRLRSTKKNADGTTTYEWFVKNPINNYNVSVNAGSYAHWSEVYKGEKGDLTLDFFPLAIHLDTAKVMWQQAKPMLACFEKWFGPSPFYEDGYKLVEAPHLGMEHQSAVAYGNRFKQGYLGRDLSGTGIGLKWDFITVHESGHEWFGNNITAKDQADMWIHEGFTNYSEGIYTECQQGADAGARYIIGSRRNIRNDAPIVAPRGVNADGSGDMYYKGGSMLHMIRQLTGNDALWRSMLRGMNKTFYHQTVTDAQIRSYMSTTLKLNLAKVFEQYLETTKIPVLEYRVADGKLQYRWSNVVTGFAMPVDVRVLPNEPRPLQPGEVVDRLPASSYTRLRATEAWQTYPGTFGGAEVVVVNPDFYVTVKKVD
jgi:aminopeptidase N